MSTERVFRLTGVKDRQSLISELDFAVCASGGRIAAGTYEVSIRRLSKSEVETLKREAVEEREPDPEQVLRDTARWSCTGDRCRWIGNKPSGQTPDDPDPWCPKCGCAAVEREVPR